MEECPTWRRQVELRSFHFRDIVRFLNLFCVFPIFFFMMMRVLIVGGRMPNLEKASGDPIMVLHQMAAPGTNLIFQKDKMVEFIFTD